jgi:hypothetical protein
MSFIVPTINVNGEKSKAHHQKHAGKFHSSKPPHAGKSQTAKLVYSGKPQQYMLQPPAPMGVVYISAPTPAGTSCNQPTCCNCNKPVVKTKDGVTFFKKCYECYAANRPPKAVDGGLGIEASLDKSGTCLACGVSVGLGADVCGDGACGSFKAWIGESMAETKNAIHMISANKRKLHELKEQMDHIKAINAGIQSKIDAANQERQMQHSRHRSMMEQKRAAPNAASALLASFGGIEPTWDTSKGIVPMKQVFYKNTCLNLADPQCINRTNDRVDTNGFPMTNGEIWPATVCSNHCLHALFNAGRRAEVTNISKSKMLELNVASAVASAVANATSAAANVTTDTV